jgi:hypothetical protein
MASTEQHETPSGISEDSTWSSASKLGRKVRELAHRSFRAIKSSPESVAQTQRRSSEVVEDLRDLRGQVARLQHKIHDRKLGPLIPWIDALRQQVEDRLGRAAKAEE